MKIQDKISKKEWVNSQKSELDFHKTNNWRKNAESFYKSNTTFFKELLFNENDFENKKILDLGAGSKLRTSFFKNVDIYVIEPLANEFNSNIAWCNLNNATQVYSVSAETKVEDLVGQMDAVLSINVIDHCYNFTTIINNILEYLNKDGKAHLMIDLHEKIDKMHPIILTDEYAQQIFNECGFKIDAVKKIKPFHRGISKVAMYYTLSKK